jgi:2'-5' RNA ligase
MVKIPEPLAEEVRCYGASIPSVYLVKGNEDAPSGLSNDVHITVKYGLLEDDPEKVAGVIAGTEPILVRLGRASIFHNENEAVLKLGVESPGLKALHHKLAGSLRTVNTYRDYRPHVTVA